MAYVLGLIGAAALIIVGIVIVVTQSLEFDIVYAAIVAILALFGIVLKKQA